MQRDVLVLTVFSVLLASVWAVASTAAPPLLTLDQQAVQSQAGALLAEPAVEAARAAALKRYTAAPPARLADGKSLLVPAVDEAVYGTLLTVANDAANPKVVWNEEPPYSVGTMQVPGARYAGDDPDRIYRTIAVSPAYQYEIHGQRRPEAALDFSFETITGPALWGKAQTVLQARDIDVAGDGSFLVTADATPADGRRNHLQLPPGTANVLVRDTLADWTQWPNELLVKRIDQATVEPASHDVLVKRAALEVEASIDESLKFIAGVWKNPPNHLFPVVRGLGGGVKGGVVAINRFTIKDDEALVITVDPISAKYVGIEVTDPWLRSADYQHRSTSLSNVQAKADADGSFTYVLALADPGVVNWLDAGGLHEGMLIVRWELFPGAPRIDKAVREVRLVKLSKLTATLPAGTGRITAAERQQWLTARSEAYERRLAQR